MKNKLIVIIIILLLLYMIPTLSLSYFENTFSSSEEGPIDIAESIDSIITTDESEIRYIEVYHINSNKVLKLEIEEYIMGVVAAEMPAQFELDALKAQAITARTYLLYKLKKTNTNPEQHTQAPICSGTHCQVYLTKEELIQKFTQTWYDTYWPKIESAVNSTKGQILTYEGKLIEPLFHSTSGGRTENSEDVFTSAAPYLRSVESPYEANSPKLTATITIPIIEFITKLKGSLGENDINATNLKDKISLIEVSEGGKIKTMQIGETIITGRDFRTLYNLNSSNFKLVQNNENIEIITTGYGHGVGMSQYGANGMAIEGFNYRDILKHYYTGIEIMQYN
ncbi:stage II sporulation protein D [Sedimentibacter sp. zth1]|uniref:stage II sporulation protein D n=1 Tax=Sedimentibacter sp. zth1 TaxID=2816908 RepID=UPI001A90DD02|nr:stage II sporulation protein D [Sedimentibacter sp. zth1]QSX05030.1 stage II sporulation protein D [Sedimentibacter sp. zth1]